MAQRRPRPTKGFASAGPARVPVSDRLSGFRLVNTGRLQGPIPVGAASFSCDRLPKLDTISLRIGNPAKLSEVIAFAFWIDGDTFVYQTVQHSIEVIHLEIDHRFLRRREVCIVWFEKGEDDLSVLRRWGKRECSLGLRQTEMLLILLVQSFWIIRSQEYTAKASD